MKLLLLSWTFLTIFVTSVKAQDIQIDSLGFETFSMTEGDTTYLMKKYFMAFLKKGPNRDHSQEEAAVIQQGHMDHMNLMAENDQISIAGPFGDDGDTRGMIIFNVPTRVQVEELVSQDPAVIAGRLILEVRPWWAAKGSALK